jgi:hypothetical protein
MSRDNKNFKKKVIMTFEEEITTRDIIKDKKKNLFERSKLT